MSHERITRVTLATASSVLLLAALAGCGSSDPATDAGSSPEQAAPSAGGDGGGPGGGFPGASGEVAAVSGSTAQVQSQQSGQVAVTWTGDTTFTQQVDGTLDDVTVGSCVVVTTADDAEQDANEVAAASVRITEAADDGSCGVGGGQGGPGGGERPTDLPTDMPSDLPEGMPTDLPSDGAGGQRPGGFGTVGEVTALADGGFTVTTVAMGDQDATEVTVAVDDATTYTTTAAAKASAVKVGRCVTAQGETDDTGALTARTISVSDPVDGECTSGFGGFARGAGGAA